MIGTESVPDMPTALGKSCDDQHTLCANCSSLQISPPLPSFFFCVIVLTRYPFPAIQKAAANSGLKLSYTVGDCDAQNNACHVRFYIFFLLNYTKCSLPKGSHYILINPGSIGPLLSLLEAFSLVFLFLLERRSRLPFPIFPFVPFPTLNAAHSPRRPSHLSNHLSLSKSLNRLTSIFRLRDICFPASNGLRLLNNKIIIPSMLTNIFLTLDTLPRFQRLVNRLSSRGPVLTKAYLLQGRQGARSIGR